MRYEPCQTLTCGRETLVARCKRPSSRKASIGVAVWIVDATIRGGHGSSVETERITRRRAVVQQDLRLRAASRSLLSHTMGQRFPLELSHLLKTTDDASRQRSWEFIAQYNGLIPAGRAQAQVVQRNPQFRLPASYDFTFL